jgi:hypothetical protein
MGSIRNLLTSVATVVAVSFLSIGAARAESLDGALDDLAKRFVEYTRSNIRGQSITSIRVGEFRSVAPFETAGGKIQSALQQKVETLIKKDAKSPLTVNPKGGTHDLAGKLLMETSADGQTITIRIITTVATSSGTEMQQFSNLAVIAAADLPR